MNASTYACINLQALAHNFNVVRQQAPNALVMAVIKADAYGHGALRVAKALIHADAFAVARIDEAIILRKANFSQRIILLEGFTNHEELKACLHYQFEPVIHCQEQVSTLDANQYLSPLSLWLKLDSGMNRLGFKINEFQKNYHHLTINSNHRLYLMTHLANADNQEDNKTLHQIRLFKATIKPFKTTYSIANSAGILAWKEALADWVRPGLMLYGGSPFANNTGKDLGLKPVMSLHSQVIAIKTLKQGETVGYGGTWVAQKKTRLGVIAIGYGDGYPRHASRGTPVLINGHHVPLIGRVSMDMLTVDLSAHPFIHVYDKVMLWGDEHLPVEKIADKAKTIPYTLLCGVSSRVPRIEKLIFES